MQTKVILFEEDCFMNKHILHRPELRRLYRALLAISLAVLAQVGGRDVRGEAAQPDALRVGLARVCITPEKPIWLHGYAGKTRFRPFEGKLNDLYAKAMALEDARGKRAVLITVDLCVLRAAEAETLFGRLTERTGLQRRQLLLNFSHTHSGPILGSSDLDRYPMSAEERQATLEYTTRLFEKIADVALAALADLKPATLAWGTGGQLKTWSCRVEAFFRDLCREGDAPAEPRLGRSLALPRWQP